jgi:CubicO group peptidase (beta-lactamase class C family)
LLGERKAQAAPTGNRRKGITMYAEIRRIITLALLLLILAGTDLSASRAATVLSHVDFSAIDEYIKTEVKRSHVPGLAVSIVKDDQIVFMKGYGVADSSQRAVTGQTPFIIGSVTKSLTALAVMQLVEAGRMDLDAPVQKYLPWFRMADPAASAQITVRHLLNQTSGLSQTGAMRTMTWSDSGNDALEKSVRYLANVELNRPVGKSYGYSNANYITLGMIVQSVSGQSYEAYVRERIFAPLEMQNSYVSQDEALQHGMASGYRWWLGWPLPVTLPYNRSNLPAGYVIASAEDMGHFLIAQMNGGRYNGVQVLSPQGITLMHTEPTPDSYGMGWFLDKVEGHTIIGHHGETSNFQAAMLFEPQTNTGVFVTANVIGMLDAFSSPLGTTTSRIAKSVLSLAIGGALPEQGGGVIKLYWIVGAVLLFLTGLLVAAVARVPGRYRRLGQRGSLSRSGLVWRRTLAVFLHFLWPAGLLCLALVAPPWQVTATMQPDLACWLYGAALIVFIKGVVEIVILGKIYERSQR